MEDKEKVDVEKEYAKWCKEIAEANDEEELIAHFRRHVSRHYLNHKPEGEMGMLIWMIAVFGFVNIFKEKFKDKYNISIGDMLFENCIHLKEHKKGPIPSFDVDKFLEQHTGKVKDYYFQPWRKAKWQKNDKSKKMKKLG